MSTSAIVIALTYSLVGPLVAGYLLRPRNDLPVWKDAIRFTITSALWPIGLMGKAAFWIARGDTK